MAETALGSPFRGCAIAALARPGLVRRLLESSEPREEGGVLDNQENVGEQATEVCERRLREVLSCHIFLFRHLLDREPANNEVFIVRNQWIAYRGL